MTRVLLVNKNTWNWFPATTAALWKSGVAAEYWVLGSVCEGGQDWTGYAHCGRGWAPAPRLLLRLTVHQPPVQQRVIDEGFQHGHDTVLVLPKHLHHGVARDPVVAIKACDLRVGQSCSPRKSPCWSPKALPPSITSEGVIPLREMIWPSLRGQAGHASEQRVRTVVHMKQGLA